MACVKSNYSWDIEINCADGMIFLDKRSDKPTENILNYDTVAETALDHQPMDNDTVNGIKSLMKESREIRNSFLHESLMSDPVNTVNLDDENPFIEDEHQVATRIGYVYKIWKIQEEKPEIGQKMKRICVRC